MTPITVGPFGIGVRLIPLFSGMQIGLGMGLAGFLGFAALSGLGPALRASGQLPTLPFLRIYLGGILWP